MSSPTPKSVDNALPPANNDDKLSQGKNLRYLMSYIWSKGSTNFKIRIIIALSFLVLAKLLNIQVPFFFKSIIDGINIDWENEVGTMATIVGGAILAYGSTRFGAVLFGELRNAIFATVAQSAIKKVSDNLFIHLLRMDFGFHMGKHTGGLTRAINRGTKGISYVLSATVFHILPISFEIAMVSGILTYNYGLGFAAVTLVTIWAYSIFTIRTTVWRAGIRRKANAADNQAANIALDSLMNFESVKFFNNEEHQAQKYRTALRNYRYHSIRSATSLAFLNSGQNLIFTSALTAMMYMAANGVVSGSLTVGDLVLINQLVFQLSVPLNFLGSVYKDMKQSLLDMETLFKLLNNPVTIFSSPNAPPLTITKGEIIFEDVTFGYRPDRPILHNASFVIPGGEKVAIVGPSGAGKSTILRLVFRFYDVQKGRILIDGQDIRDVDLDSLRRAIGVVPQDTALFNETILENIRYGNLSASDEDVQRAISQVDLDKMTSNLPEGINTVVGERGMMISGGERQKLAIARVLLKNAPITFFDEATSALDRQSLQKTMRSVFKKNERTIVSIAHRLRTVADSDKIIVLEKGRVREEGDHQNLLRKEGGLYSELWHIQEDLHLDFD
jgi:ABC transporter ATM